MAAIRRSAKAAPVNARPNVKSISQKGPVAEKPKENVPALYRSRNGNTTGMAGTNANSHGSARARCPLKNITARTANPAA